MLHRKKSTNIWVWLQLSIDISLPKPHRCPSKKIKIKKCVPQSSEVQHHREPTGDCRPCRVRLAPEGGGGTRVDPHRNMCQRADAVPSYKSLPGSLGDRIRSTVSSAGGTLCRSAMSVNPGFGRSEGKVARCEKCSATLVALKKQALSLAVHHHFSCKVSVALRRRLRGP